MTTIERYIFRRVFFASVGAFGAILAVVWVTQAVTRVDLATSTGAAISAFLTMMLMLMPQFITLTLPFGLLIGTMNVLNTMNADSEMPVVAGTGMGRLSLARPLLILALCTGALIFLINHLVEPAANRAVRDIITQARTDLLATLIVPGRFTRLEDGLTIYIDGKDDNVLSGIMIADTRDENQHLIQYARVGTVDESSGEAILILNDGQIHRQDTSSGAISIIRFQSYAISLSQFASAGGEPRYFLHERGTPYLLDPDPNDPMVNNLPGQVAGELHRRFTEWLYAPLMVLIALGLAGQPRSHRVAGMTAMILAFCGALLYRWAAYFSYNEIKGNGALFWLLYAVPLIGIGANAALFLTGRSVAIPDRVTTSITRWAGAVENTLFKRDQKKVA